MLDFLKILQIFGCDGNFPRLPIRGFVESLFIPINPLIIIMKITRKDRNGQRREALLKEYFITASLIALLKRVGEEAGKVVPARVQASVAAKAAR